jgi:Zn-dependent protease with chaperone function
MTPRSSKDLLVLRLLATLISLTVVGLGSLAVWTAHYYGRTSKLGGAELVLDGGPAVAIGWVLVSFGLLPLALWFSGKRPALVWCGVCAVAAGVFLYLALFAAR